VSSRPHALHDLVLALPITGESFLLRRRGHTVLVDGGWKKDKIADVLAAHFPAVTALDVIVCTHGDGDHAGGLPNLLSRWPGRIGQLWLPGRWVDVVPDLLKDPKGFVDGLMRELNTVIRKKLPDPIGNTELEQAQASFGGDPVGDSKLSEEGTGDQESDNPSPTSEASWSEADWGDDDVDFGDTESTDEPDWFAELRRSSALPTDKAASDAFGSGRSRIRYRESKGRIGTASALAWLRLIDTVEAIRGIAAAAMGRRLRIRWFDFDAFSDTRRPSGGVPGFLVPINAREQAPPPFEGNFLARLTRINRESLVFFAPPRWHRLGVLFCGDSPLGDGQKFGQSFLQHSTPPGLPIVATAPHHGAETNSAAYAHMSNWADVMVLLRTGGDRKQPGATFKALGWPFKVCATCPQSNRTPRLAGVAGPGRHRWFPPAIVMGIPCDCT